jgi:hypothetical protein
LPANTRKTAEERRIFRVRVEEMRNNCWDRIQSGDTGGERTYGGLIEKRVDENYKIFRIKDDRELREEESGRFSPVPGAA